jgi:hypothetical protein
VRLRFVKTRRHVFSCSAGRAKAKPAAIPIGQCRKFRSRSIRVAFDGAALDDCRKPNLARYYRQIGIPILRFGTPARGARRTCGRDTVGTNQGHSRAVAHRFNSVQAATCRALRRTPQVDSGAVAACSDFTPESRPAWLGASGRPRQEWTRRLESRLQPSAARLAPRL